MESLRRCVLLVCGPPFSPTNSNASSVAHCTKQWSGKENLSLPSGCMVTYGNRSRFNGDLRDLHQLMAQSEILGSFDVNRCGFYIQKLWIVPEAFQSERRRNTGCTRSVLHAHGRHKSSIIAGLLAIFLWPVGAHKFYNGSWGWGIIYIVIIVAAFINPNPALGILWISEFILALIQGIWWLANPVYYHRKYNETSPFPMKW
ncbi:TM2 domain-containing protein [Akkermansia sp. N21169]|uniref:TM2 domain-containing protein n=1 Tax=Akkermansia sp. N21169 TaxID=3040765 RepID=UPI00244EE26C|nr:TM2 domain-containing protein [Akkermansia sp. N21169]MDH3069342.1 TM2 domain-containing protein [Akkermansia sp. N21169]